MTSKIRQESDTRRSGEPASVTTLRGLMRHAWNMTLLWLAFGIVVGVAITPPGGNWIGPVSNALAGMIVLSPVGLLLGMLGARRRDSLVCGGAGLLLGALAGAAGAGPVGSTSATGLIIGGMVGATFIAFFYRLPRLLLSRFAIQS